MSKKEDKDYSVYTYSVGMIISVFAETEKEAREKLDDKGGFLSHREVELKDVQPIYQQD